MGRFLNADSLISTGQGVLGYNMYTYCSNNPIMGYDPTGHWDFGWQDQAFLGSVVLMVGLALLFAPPTGGASLGGLAISAATISAAGSAAAVTGTIIIGDSLNQATANFAKQSRKSGKEKANDHPSWLSQNDIDLNESSHQNATELLNDKYGIGNWRKGPGSEYNQIVKWIDRGLKSLVLFVMMLLEE